MVQIAPLEDAVLAPISLVKLCLNFPPFVHKKCKFVLNCSQNSTSTKIDIVGYLKVLKSFELASLIIRMYECFTVRECGKRYLKL